VADHTILGPCEVCDSTPAVTVIGGGASAEFAVCASCAREADIEAERCPYCKCSPCADPRGCEADGRADDRAERGRDEGYDL